MQPRKRTRYTVSPWHSLSSHIYYRLTRSRTVDRVAWFKGAIQGSSGAVSDEEMHLLTQRLVFAALKTHEYLTLSVSFIDREDDDLAEARQERRPGRPPTKAEGRILQRKEVEEREFRGGLWVPELRNEESRSKVERWAGEWGGLNTLDFVRIVQAASIEPSSFPPKANS